MKSSPKLILIILINLTFFTPLIAQEICNNGQDDDGDGFIDCFDGDCASNIECEDFFFGTTVQCYDDVDVTSFAIRQQWKSENTTATSHASPVVGDLDYDGIPEIITINNKNGDMVYVLDGATGNTIHSIAPGWDPENTPAIANVDRDEVAEVLVTENEGNDMVLYTYLNNELVELWDKQASSKDMGIAGFADFNEDGTPEVYYKNEIRNAVTGDIIITGSGDWERDYVHGPIAIDIVDATDPDCISLGGNCDGLELITGNEIWAVDISDQSMVVVKNMNDALAASGKTGTYHTKYWTSGSKNRSCVSVADYTLDGNIDVLLSGALGSDFSGETTVFMWDVANGTTLTFHDPFNDFEKGTGRINIADVDGDGFPNANFVMDEKLYSLDENFGIHWIHGVKEGSSGFTGCTLFDFDGDGTVETVYRSEEFLLILDGVGNGDGTTFERNSLPCVSRTQEEYPIVADVDGDGASEICVTCFFDDATDFSDYDNTGLSGVRIFESDGEAWMPARKVWNQHGYFNVNINDDLSVPIEVQDHSVEFSDGLCEFSDGSTIPFPSRPLNTFLTQSPILDENGCVEFVAPDILILEDNITATNAQCPDNEITATFNIFNDGDTQISGTLPVSYYVGDPTVATSTYLETQYVTLVGFDKGETLNIVHTINGIGGSYDLYIIVNDFGGTPPIANSLDELPASGIPECETDNNFAILTIDSDPFPLTVEKLEDDRRCEPYVTDANGSATAYYEGSSPGGQETIWLENFEDLSNGTTNDTGETAWTSDEGSVSADSYGVATFNSSKMFGGEDLGGGNASGSVTWTSEAIDISNHTDVSVIVDVFENGTLEDASKQGYDFFRIEYEIFDASNTPISSGTFDNGFVEDDFTFAQASLTGLRPTDTDLASSIVITATLHTSYDNESMFIDNINVSGTGPAETRVFTEADGYRFYWFNEGDYSDTLHTGGTNYQMAAGTYDVIGEFPSTNCISDIVSVTIETVEPDVHVWAYPVSSLTSCSVPDGILSAFVYTSTTNGTFPADEGAGNLPLDTLRTVDGYTFTWFIEAEGITPIATGDTARNLSAIAYTAEAYESFSGCEGAGGATVLSDLTTLPPPTVTVTPITSCGGTGFLSADVNGNTTDFTFEWYGPSGNATPDFTGPVYEVSVIGEYTVIATKNDDGCTTEEGAGTMADNSNPPTGSYDVTDNTACEGGNGIVSVDGDGAGTVTGYTFTWYKGANTLVANELPGTEEPTAFFVDGNTHELGGLSTGTYRIVITEDATNCTDTVDAFVDDLSEPLATSGSPIESDIAGCDDSVFGSVDASGMVSGSTYRFELFEGTVASGTADFINTTGIFNGLEESEYVLVIYDELTECPSAQIDVEIERIEDIPTITTVVIDDTFCTEGIGSGSIEVTSSASTAGTYTYEIYEGNSFSTLLTSSTNVDGTTGHIFENLPDGDYRIQVINETTQCSDFVDLPVEPNETNPTFSTTVNSQDNTSCDTGNPNGSIAVTVNEGPASNYHFTWYDNPDTTGLTPIDADDGLNELTELDGDITYAVVARDLVTGCSTLLLTESIGNTPYVPNVVIEEVSPQTDCGTGNGSLRAYVTNDPDDPSCTECTANFSFQWQLDGIDLSNTTAAANGSIPSGVDTHTVSGLISDEYTVVVTHTNTCSVNANFNLSEDQNFPIITLDNKQNNEFCDPASYNGFITVQVEFDGESPVADLSSYTFTWYNGSGNTKTLNTSSTSATLSSINEGEYSVVVQAPNTCASDTTVFDIIDVLPTIVAGESGLTGDSVCDPALNDPANPDANGTVTLTPTGGTGTGNFAFALETSGGSPINNDGSSPGFDDVTYDNAGVTATTVDGLPIGNYVMTITDESSGCSIDHPFSINDATVDPVLDEVTINANTTDNTSCSPGNYTGTATVTITEITGAGANLSDYSFFWATATDPATQIDDDNILDDDISGNSGVEDGEYILIVTDLVTGCISATADITIDPAQPTITAGESGLTGDSVCDPALNDPANPDANGTVTLTPTGGTGTGNFAFALETSGGSPINNDGSSSGFDDVTYDNAGVTATTVDGLPIGNYVMTITDESSGCSIDHPFSINDATVDPILDEVTINANTTDNTSCSPGDYTGTATVTITEITGAGANLSDYSFFWATATDPATQIDDDNILDDDISGNSGVEDGEYILIVTDLVTGCISATADITIDPAQPTITAGESGLAGDPVCDPAINDPANPDANGTVTLTPTGGTGTGNFAFALETSGGSPINNDGSSPGFDDVAYDNAGVTATTVDGLPIGNYVMTITDESSGCSIDHPFSINDATVDPVLDEVTINANTTDNTSCSPGNYTGTATVTITEITGAGANLSDYSFFWATATDPATQIDDDNILDDDISGNSGVEDGEYILIVTDLVTGCISATADITIDPAQPTITAGESGLAGDSVCDPALNDPANPDANGTITLTPTGGTGTGNFAFALETSGGSPINNDGSSTGFDDVTYDNAGVTATTVDGLPIGNYVMTITDESSGCSIDHPFSINDATVDPVLDEVTINANTTDNTSCSSGDYTGTATVTITEITGAGANLSDYSFFWATATDPATQIDDDNILDDDISGNSGVEDGEYILIVTDLVTGCISATADITIDPAQPTITAGESGLAGDPVCDPALNDPANPDANGTITLTPTGGTGTGNFAFALETSGGSPINNDGSSTGFDDVAYDNAGVTATTVDGLPIGNYVMTITDESSGCSIDHPFSINDATVDPVLDEVTINANTTDNTSCSPGDYTGAATVTITEITGTGANLSDYSFFWATATDPATQIDDDNILDDDISGNSGVEDGEYVLIVTDLVTGCISTTADITIDPAQPTIAAGESGLTGDSVCDPAINDPANPDANGTVTLTPTGGTGTGNFAFALETSGGSPINNDGSSTGFDDVTYDNAGVTATTVDGLPIGNYVMTITDESSGCSIDHPFSINDATVDPVLDEVTINANTTDNTTCDPTAYDGTATVTITEITGAGANLSDYSFFWATATDPATQIDDDNILDDDISGNSGVEDGEYVLIVTDLVTGCISATANITINPNIPTITPTTQVLQDNFTCDAANPIGSADVSVAEGSNTDYSFAWYVGTSAVGIVIDTDDQIDNQLDGTYTVLVTDNATLCTATEQVTIGDFEPTLSVNSSSSVDHTQCYPSNGQVSVTPTLTFNPLGPPTGLNPNYTYVWYFGSSATAGNELVEGVDPGNLSNPTDVTSSTVTGLSAGMYTVVITETQTGCVSGIETITVADEVSPYQPTIEFTSDVTPSSCDGDNGQITAEITALGAGAPNADGGGLSFTFEWYEGAQDYASLELTGSAEALETGDFLVANPSPGNAVTASVTPGGIGATATLGQIVSGLYTLVMIDQTTGCRYFETYDLGYSGQQVTTTLTIDNVTACPDNGAARVGLADNIILTVSSQSDEFIIGESFTAAPSGATGTIGADQLTGTVQVTLDDGSAALAVSDVITGATSSETATIDAIDKIGYATGADEFDDISQYIVYLYAGSGVPADRLAPYTFEGRVFPYSYNPATGDILDGDGNPLTSSPGPALNAGDEAEFPELPAGNYIAIAQEIDNPAFNPGSTSNCWTAASVDEEILDLAYEPVVQSYSETDHTNCDITVGNGELSITVIEDPEENLNGGDAQPDGFQFDWVRDSDSFAYPSDVQTGVETATSSINNLIPGNYTVTITRLGGAGNTSNMCSVTENLTVGNIPEQHLITNATIGDNEDCSPLDGSAVINDADITDNAADYSFTWYTTFIAAGDVGNILLNDAFVDGGDNGDPGVNSVSGLEGGTYYVEAVHDVKTCETPVFEVVIPDLRVIPTFNVAATAEDIVCDDASFTPTGQATLTITNGTVNPTAINWYENDGTTALGTITTTASFSANNEVVSNLPANTYFVEIVDDNSPGLGCSSVTLPVTIDPFETIIYLETNADFAITHADDCDPENGAFEITNITETRPGGSTVSISDGDYAISDYSFNWFESDGTTLIDDALVVGFNNGDDGANQVEGLTPDTYYVQITNVATTNGTGCQQATDDFIEFTIINNKVTPTFNVVPTAEDIVCDDASFTPTGQATVTITNGSAIPADYTFSWFEDAGEAQALDGTGSVAAPLFSANNSVVDQLPAGTYFVRIEDNVSTGLGCESVLQSVTIDPFETIIYLESNADFAITHADDCDPENGAFEITNITETRPGGSTVSISDGDYAISDYSFNWFESDGTTLIDDALVVGFNNGDDGANQVEGLTPDTYYVQITNVATTNGTGCQQATDDFIEFTIINNKVTPTFNVVATAEDIVCDDATFTPTGQATVTITNGSANPADYTFSWFEDAGEAQALDGTGSVAAPLFSANNSVVDQLPAGTYFVRIEDNVSTGLGCESVLQSVTIDPFETIIYLESNADFAITHADDCDPENGAFEITNITETRPGGSTVSISDGDYAISDYSFNWFESDGTTLIDDVLVVGFNNGDDGANQVEGLTPDTYYVQITNVATTNGTGCQQATDDFIEFTIINNKVTPTFNVVATAEDIVCDDASFTPTGQATVTITNGSANPADYTFSWFEDAGEAQALDGTGSVAAPLFSANNSVVDQLPAGTYFVRIEDNVSTGLGCESVLQSVTIDPFETIIYLESNADFAITHADDCDPENGAFEITNITETRPGGSTVSISDGDYAISDYSFNWFESDGTTLIDDALVVGFNNGDDGANQVEGLTPDTYYVQITNVATTNGTGCQQSTDDFIEFTIINNKVTPTFNVVATAEDIVCDDASFTPTGQATVTITNGSANPADYTFSWFEDAGEAQALDGTGSVAAPLFSANNSVVDQLPAGTYFVRIEDNVSTGLGCESVLQSVTIDPFETIIYLETNADFAITHADDCDPENGAFEITNITETRPGGSTVSISDGDYAISDYSFNWFESDGTTLIDDALVVGFNNGDDGANQVEGLTPDTYYVQITNVATTNGTGCQQSTDDFIEFTIINNKVTPTFNVVATAEDIVCDDASFTPTGQATVTITNGSAIPADYTFSWFEDAGEAQALDGSGSVAAPLFSANNSVVDQLPAGTYFVRIEDNVSTGLGCESVLQSVTIDPFETIIYLETNADFAITHTDDCDPENGAFEITNITETRPGGSTVSISDGDYAISDYSFNWFESDGTTLIDDALVVGFNNGDDGANQVEGLTPDTYYVQITNVATTNGTGCQQATDDFIEFTIENEVGTITLAKDVINSTDDTYCDNTNFVGDGSLTVTITEDGANATLSDYSVEWYRGAYSSAPGTTDVNFLADESDATGTNSGNANVGDAAVGTNILTLEGLSDGSYTVFITKSANSPNVGCTRIATFDVGSDEDIPTIDEEAIKLTVAPDSLCTGFSGSFSITDADIDGLLSDYNIQITQGNGGPDVHNAPGVSPLDMTTLEPDEYYIVAENITTGCITATAIVTVPEFIRNPEIDLVSVTPNENCGGTVSIGGAEVIVNNQFDHTNAAFLTFQWIDVASGSNVSIEYPGVIDNQATLTGVPAGEYTVTVVNSNTSCSATLPVTIPNEELDIIITDYDLTDVTICGNNGTFSIVEILENGSPLTPAAMTGIYELEVYNDEALTSAVTDTDATDFIMENLAIDSYFGLVRNTASNCTSNVISFDIVDDITYPGIQISLVAADSTCDGTVTPTGELSATADGVDDTDPTYTFTWFEGSGTGTPLGLTTSTISDLPSGTYTLVVLNTATGCSTQEEFEVPHVPTNVDIVTMDVTDDTSCSAGIGSITVTAVSVDDISDYTFDYYDQDPSSGSVTPMEDDYGATLNDLEAGTYFVIGYNTRLGCTTPPFQIDVVEDVVYPVISLESFDSQTNCDDTNPNGRLTIFVDGAVPTADYNIEWYAEGDLGGTILSSDDTLSNLAQGIYIAQVENNISGCISEQSFTISDEIMPIEPNVSISPNTSCEIPNGVLAVSIIQTAPGRTISDYDYLWYDGQVDNPDPSAFDYSGTLIDSLAAGQYTVLIVDQTDNVCMSDPLTVNVPDRSVYPPYEFFKSNLTLCFEDQKNGSAQVIVDRALPINQNIMVEWFDENNSLISTNEFIDSLDIGQYSVTLTNLTNGCDTTQIFFIDNLPPEVPVPTLTLTGNRTNCSEPNGQAIANVDGITEGYLFEWFDIKDTETVYTTGSQVFNLDSGTYMVIATNLSTGCTSSNTISSAYEVTNPIFEVQYELATCLRTEDGAINQFDGTAIVAFDQFNNVAEYRWENEAGETVGEGSRLIDSSPGIYTVYFTADNGCEYSETFELGTDITIYNGLSPNDDGLNDFLLIDCIDYFTNNKVKIFNRAGVKVFETDYYNNTSNRFEGFSNVGGSAFALPTGTYFTIVELNDGREPMQFYLELVR